MLPVKMAGTWTLQSTGWKFAPSLPPIRLSQLPSIGLNSSLENHHILPSIGRVYLPTSLSQPTFSNLTLPSLPSGYPVRSESTQFVFTAHTSQSVSSTRSKKNDDDDEIYAAILLLKLCCHKISSTRVPLKKKTFFITKKMHQRRRRSTFRH
jgi:hypothetical protein